MPLNLDNENNNPFFMYDIIEYPEHMKSPEQREAFYEEAVEAFNFVSDMIELEEFEDKYMQNMKWMTKYKHDKYKNKVAEMRLIFADSPPY